MPCSNIVGLLCLIDFYFIKNKDMILHHILILSMIRYLNNYNNSIKNINNIISILLSTEISTIFLITNNLINNMTNISFLKNINKFIFIYTFVYYRIYNYFYYMIFNRNIINIFLGYSTNIFEICEIYIDIYGLFILNLYWTCLIFKKTLFKNNYKIGEKV